MIEILASPPHLAAFHFTRILDGDDYDRCIEVIESKLEVHDRIAIFCDMTGMTGLTPVALGKDLRYALGKIGEYRRFARGEVVTGHDCLAKGTGFAAVFFPHTALRTFPPDEREEAMAWASGPLGDD